MNPGGRRPKGKEGESPGMNQGRALLIEGTVSARGLGQRG